MSKKTAATIEDILTSAGFQTLEKRGEKILVASGAEDFGKSHATFLQAAEKHPALLGCSRLDQLGGPVLLVHRSASPKPQNIEQGISNTEEIVNPQSEIDNAN